MKDIKGFEGLYAITSCGKVWSYKYNKFLTDWPTGRGYRVVKLHKDGKKWNKRIHVLVAEAYLEKPTDGQNYDVGHLDDCPYHNWVGNLKWMTRKEKQKTKLFTKVRCVETGEIFKDQRAAARAVGIHPQGITNVLSGYQRTAGGYHWERFYEDEEKNLE